MSESAISHISDTARWVATYRAMETERPDALFHDPYARRLSGTHGVDIVNSMKKGRQFAWPMIVRTAVMDEIIMRTVQREQVDAVLNLAAGLDARPYRLPLPATLAWVDADLPGILSYKQEQLASETPRCRYEAVQIDLTDVAARRAVFHRVAAAHQRVLVVAEGLLVYLTAEQVAALARDLRAEPTFRWWLIDIAGPRILKMMEKTWGKTVRAGNAPFQFAPAESTAFFEPHGWHEQEFRSMFDESIRLGRTFPMAKFWRWVGRTFYSKKKQEEFHRMSGIALLTPS